MGGIAKKRKPDIIFIYNYKQQNTCFFLKDVLYLDTAVKAVEKVGFIVWIE